MTKELEKELFNDYINGLSVSSLRRKYKISPTRIYKIIFEYARYRGSIEEKKERQTTLEEFLDD